jgi:ubiquitin C-terminal hydrolase
MDSKLIELYTNKLLINGNSITDIINLDDHNLAVNLKYILWFFPTVNTLSERDKYILSTNRDIRKIITKLVYRVTSTIDNSKLTNRIAEFLHFIDMAELLSTKTFKGLHNTRNSCYMDSVIIALFTVKNKIIDKYILYKDLNSISKKWISCSSRDDIRSELLRITHSLRGGPENITDVKTLRTYLQNCKGSQDFHKGGMQDPGEFLLYLFNIFEVSTMTKRRKTYITNSIENPPKDYIKISEEIQYSTPVINIPHHKIRRGLDISTFLKQTDDAIFSKENFYRHEHTGITYKRRIETNIVLSSSYIVFNIERVTISEEFIDTKIEIPTELTLLDNSSLELHSVVTYENRHYTCYFKNNDKWYYYDDLQSGAVHVKNYLSSSPSIENNGTLLFYTSK